MTATKFNITEAHRITGKSRTTIKKHIKQGKLSAEQDDNGNPVVDASELARCYNVSTADFERASASSKSTAGVQTSGGQPAGQLTSNMQQLLDSEVRLRQRLEQQLDELHEVLKRTQEGHERAMRLIEDRSQTSSEWEKPLKALQAQVANQEKAHQKFRELAHKRIAKVQQELEQERSKSWLVKLLSRE
ncbi:hypothetical protein [Aeoliella sp.]|uniref:hypothetical protein n=1 Tax=Aeoliella sp. TaxID=2795800 RepID=UPI003CCC3CBD